MRLCLLKKNLIINTTTRKATHGETGCAIELLYSNKIIDSKTFKTKTKVKDSNCEIFYEIYLIIFTRTEVGSKKSPTSMDTVIDNNYVVHFFVSSRSLCALKTIFLDVKKMKAGCCQLLINLTACLL